MKSFLTYLLEKDEWNRIKPSDLPPVNKVVADRDSKERESYRAINKEVLSKQPTGKEYTDLLPYRSPKSTKPGVEEFRKKTRSDAIAAARGSKTLDPERDLDAAAFDLNPDRYDPPPAEKRVPKDEYQTAAKGKPHISLDTTMGAHHITPPESARSHFNPAYKTKSST